MRGNVYICVGVVGYGTIAKESNIQRYIKELTAVPYIRRLSVSTYISENATVVTYIKEDATVSTLFSNTEQRVYILADGETSSLYKRLNPATAINVINHNCEIRKKYLKPIGKSCYRREQPI